MANTAVQAIASSSGKNEKNWKTVKQLLWSLLWLLLLNYINIINSATVTEWFRWTPDTMTSSLNPTGGAVVVVVVRIRPGRHRPWPCYLRTRVGLSRTPDIVAAEIAAVRGCPKKCAAPKATKRRRGSASASVSWRTRNRRLSASSSESMKADVQAACQFVDWPHFATTLFYHTSDGEEISAAVIKVGHWKATGLKDKRHQMLACSQIH